MNSKTESDKSETEVSAVDQPEDLRGKLEAAWRDQELRKQLTRFLVAGLTAVGTDFGFYFLLINFMAKSPAKAISFIIGTVAAYLINKFWTFEKSRYSSWEIVKFIILYASTLMANVGVNKLVLLVLPGFVFLGFLMATGTSTVLNFIGQKWWVFRR